MAPILQGGSYMSTLNCSSTNCLHNLGNFCYAGSVLIDGSNAECSKGTTCSSFIDKDQSGISSYTDANKLVTPFSITCKATNCKHNENSVCTSQFVQIDYDNAKCDSFE